AFFLELPHLLQETPLYGRGWVVLEGFGINCQRFLHSTRAAKLRARPLGGAEPFLQETSPEQVVRGFPEPGRVLDDRPPNSLVGSPDEVRGKILAPGVTKHALVEVIAAGAPLQDENALEALPCLAKGRRPQARESSQEAVLDRTFEQGQVKKQKASA